MFLYAERLVGYPTEEDQKLHNILCNLISKSPDSKDADIKIKYCVGYWRKCYSINDWFLSKAIGGFEDDGKIGLADLYDLKHACIEVLRDSSKSKDLLPKSSSDSDESYSYGIISTIKILNIILDDKNSQRMKFFYRVSW